MPMLDLCFPVTGPTLATDHGYDLYAALSRLLPALHDGLDCRIAPVGGQYAGSGQLQLDARRSRLRVRLAAEGIPHLLPLAGKALEVGGHRVRLGVPQVSALEPAPALFARLVTIKGFTEPAPFLEAVRRQLDDLQIAGQVGIPLGQSGPHAGEPRRRVVRIRDKKVVAFPLQVTELAAEESLRLQEHGVGGRGKMGCGFFVPVGPGGRQ